MAIPDRVFVEDEPFDTVIGDPKLKFSQMGVYYDAHKKPVKGKVRGNPLTKEQKAAVKKATGKLKKHAKAGRPKGSKKVDGKMVKPTPTGPLPEKTPPTVPLSIAAFTVPQAQAAAEKENAVAAHAEELAE